MLIPEKLLRKEKVTCKYCGKLRFAIDFKKSRQDFGLWQVNPMCLTCSGKLKKKRKEELSISRSGHDAEHKAIRESFKEEYIDSYQCRCCGHDYSQAGQCIKCYSHQVIPYRRLAQ